MNMHSALYIGQVKHRRQAPRVHEFRYPLFMAYLDLAELEQVFARRWFWSIDRANLASFRRSDHLGDPALPLADAVRELVAERTGVRPRGPIRLLTHLRYFGYCFNPVSFYYCSRRSWPKSTTRRGANSIAMCCLRAKRWAGCAAGAGIRTSACMSRHSCQWICAINGS
jgi:DUF1365 family protein